MNQKKERRVKEVRVIVQPSMYETLQAEAGKYRTISEVVREILAKYLDKK